MDKFGVQTTKIVRTCPTCGRTPRKVGAVLKCEVHGTKPFEIREEPGTHGVESESTGVNGFGGDT